MMKHLIFFIFTILALSTSGSETNSHLFPPGSVAEFNMTGPLNSFVEQLQANSRSQEIPIEPISQVVQMPQSTQGRGSVIYYGVPEINNNNQLPPPQSAPASMPPPQPVIIGPQNRPALDPALQQLLNSFNTNPTEPQRNTFIQGGPTQPNLVADFNTPVVSYITCYVGCSHVTNIVTNSAKNINPLNLLVLPVGMLLIFLF